MVDWGAEDLVVWKQESDRRLEVVINVAARCLCPMDGMDGIDGMDRKPNAAERREAVRRRKDIIRI